MSNVTKAEAQKAYEDGYRDARHGGDRNPPNNDRWGSVFMSNHSFEENKEYDKGYKAGKTSKK